MIEEAVLYIEKNIEGSNLLQDLVKQVEKDFRMAVDPTIELVALTPSELVHRVYRELYKITLTSVSKLSSLLYRIDIAEADVKAIQSVDIEDYLKQITFLILKREYQKVYIRSRI